MIQNRNFQRFLLSLLILVGPGLSSQAQAPNLPYDSLNIPTVPKTIYVDDTASGSDTGTSWANAYTNLQTALGAANPSDEIWVASGTYKPGAARGHTFQLKNGVALYGGFPDGGGDGTFIARKPKLYHTLLSGEIGNPSIKTDNTYHVVTGSGNNTTAIIDGFTITRGYTPVSADTGMGGGFYIYNGSPTVSGISFMDNFAENYGGGMANVYLGNPLVVNCTFTGNMTNGSGGGLVNLYGASTTIVNSTFAGNAAGGASAIANYSGGGAYVRNIIAWGNNIANPAIGVDSGSSISVQYSLIQGMSVYPGTGNINPDPLYLDGDGWDNMYGTLDDDLRLQETSPAVDAGDNTAVPSDIPDLDNDGNTSEKIPFDQYGKTRFIDIFQVTDTGNGSAPLVDMGAIETPIWRDINVSPVSLDVAIKIGDSTTRALILQNLGSYADLNWTLSENPEASWLTENKTSGALQRGCANQIDVTFDSAILNTGVYTSALEISSDDPDEALIKIPVSFTVQIRTIFLPLVSFGS